MKTVTLCKRVAIAVGLLASIQLSEAARANPIWYTAGTGGFNPNVPDFYQHQNWQKGGETGNWEPKGGWCYQTAIADVFYALTKRGYDKLLNANITDNTKWFDVTYKPGDVTKSEIYRLANTIPGVTVQQFVTAAGHGLNTAKPLSAVEFSVAKDGDVEYFSPAPKKKGGKVKTNASLFDFYDLATRAGKEMLLQLAPGGQKPVKGAFATEQGLWWDFHEVAGAGIDVANKTIFIADPDTNEGSKLVNAGWPRTKAAFPGDLKTAAADPIPIPGAPAIGAIASYENFYAGFKLNNKNRVNGDANNNRYDGTVVKLVHTIGPPSAKQLIAAAPVPGGVTTTLAVNAEFGIVDKVFIAPSSEVLDCNSSPSLCSFTTPGGTWTATDMDFDPFGNERLYGGIEYSWDGIGSALYAGENAEAKLGTVTDFDPTGFEIMLHFLGDPTNLWIPQIIGGTINPLDVVRDQIGVPEPASTFLLMLGAVGLSQLRLRRRGDA